MGKNSLEPKMRFIQDGKVTVCIIRAFNSQFTGVARQGGGDEYNKRIGRRLAAARARIKFYKAILKILNEIKGRLIDGYWPNILGMSCDAGVSSELTAAVFDRGIMTEIENQIEVVRMMRNENQEVINACCDGSIAEILDEEDALKAKLKAKEAIGVKPEQTVLTEYEKKEG